MGSVNNIGCPVSCLLSVVMALYYTAIPDHAIPAAFCVEVILRLLQLVLI